MVCCEGGQWGGGEEREGVFPGGGEVALDEGAEGGGEPGGFVGWKWVEEEGWG